MGRHPLRAALWAGALAFALLVPPVCIASAEPALKAVFQGRYADMKAAMAAHDANAIAALLSPDFISVDVSGKGEAAAKMIADVNALKPDSNKTSQTTILSVADDGATATVRQRYDMHTVKAGMDGVAHEIDLAALSTDTWVKDKGAWLLSRTETNELTYSIDGKIVAHRTNGQVQ
jgi:ketosteroid isomerase-like protein